MIILIVDNNDDSNVINRDNNKNIRLCIFDEESEFKALCNCRSCSFMNINEEELGSKLDNE